MAKEKKVKKDPWITLNSSDRELIRRALVDYSAQLEDTAKTGDKTDSEWARDEQGDLHKLWNRLKFRE